MAGDENSVHGVAYTTIVKVESYPASIVSNCRSSAGPLPHDQTTILAFIMRCLVDVSGSGRKVRGNVRGLVARDISRNKLYSVVVGCPSIKVNLTRLFLHLERIAH